jgi:hypothetical protein
MFEALYYAIVLGIPAVTLAGIHWATRRRHG